MNCFFDEAFAKCMNVMFTNTYGSCFNNLYVINALLQVGIHASDLHVWSLHPYHEVSIVHFFSANTEYLHSAFRECSELMNSVLKVLRLLYVYNPFLEHFRRYFKIF